MRINIISILNSTEKEKEKEFLKKTSDIFGDSKYEEVDGSSELVHTRYFQPIKVCMLVRKDDMFKSGQDRRYKLAIIKKDRSMAFDVDSAIAVTAQMRLLIDRYFPGMLK